MTLQAILKTVLSQHYWYWLGNIQGFNRNGFAVSIGNQRSRPAAQASPRYDYCQQE
jgi:hypothetical protein